MTITQSKRTHSPLSRSRASCDGTVRRAIPVLAMLFGAAAIAPFFVRMAAADPGAPPRTPTLPGVSVSLQLAGVLFRSIPLEVIRFVQGDDEDGGEPPPNKGASPDEIEKYVAVYRAMQRDHSLTVERAAGAQGFTVSAFRDLEQRIESDDLARDDARRALAEPGQSARPATIPKAQP